MNDKKLLKILALPVGTDGCGFYRIKQPMAMISQYTPHDAHVIDKDTDDGLLVAEALLEADIITYKPGAQKSKADLITLANSMAEKTGSNKRVHAKWVLDLDDNAELVSPYSGHYSQMGTQEYYDSINKVWLYKDGVDGFSLEANRQRINEAIADIKQADLVTVSTPKLAVYAKQYNKHVSVLPNGIDFTRWWVNPRLANKTLRIGWSGGMSHYEDWWSIKMPLNDLLRKHRFTLVMVGHDFTPLIDTDLRDLVEVRPWVSPDAHSYHMMALNLDIAIIPLANLPFSAYKSNIKYLEMSALEIPSVVANITPYKETIVNGKTALGYSNPDSFYTQLNKLIISPELRESIGKSSGNYVRHHYDASTLATQWIDAYQNIL